MQYGIKSMTMDDIARQLGVSKKTIYQYVTDKNDLVKKVMQLIVDNEKALVAQMNEQMENAIDMLFELTKDVSQKFGQIHPSIHYDLQKYHPEAQLIFEEFRTQFIADTIKNNIELGIKQGLFRDNLDSFIISRFYASKMELCTNSEIFPAEHYDFKTIHIELMRYHIRGIANEKGLEYLREKVKREHIQL